MNGKRTYKDSVFCDYLMHDQRRLVEVYNAAFHTDYPLDTVVEINRLEGVLYMERINDISFILDNKFVVLLEQQSTVNENMPLRMLLYIARLYEKLINSKNIYRKARIPLFTPQFVVFYNGSEEQDECIVQKLSDAFVEQIANPALELEVVLYNIRRKGDYVPAILERSKSLDDYSTLVEFVEAYRADGYSLSDAIEKAIQRCSSCGIMPEYLQENGAEVLNMLLTEWNWDDAKEVWQEEAFEAGEIKGRRDGEIIGRQSGLIEGEMKGREESKKDFALVLLQDGTFSKVKIAEMTKLELTEVEALALQLGKTE